MSGQWHPNTEAIASFRAGLIGGFRGRRLAAHIASCARCAQVGDRLGAVSSMLASVPAPALPEAFEHQISAAIAAEAATRKTATSPAHVPARHRPRPVRSRSPRLRLAIAFTPVLACLLAGFGYLLSNHGASSPQTLAERPYAGSAPMASASASAASSPLRLPAASAVPSSAAHAAGTVPSASPAVAFVVTESGTRYQSSTLGAQVRAEVAAADSTLHGLGSQSQSASATNGLIPAAPLVGCVLSVTGGVQPALVDKAFYQGESAYVIATSDRAWVVGLGCTASNHELITSTRLPATP